MMKTTVLAASLAAAFTLPAYAHEWPAGNDGKQPEYVYELDIDAIMAETEEARAKAEERRAQARERAAEAREKARGDAEAARARAREHSVQMEEWAKSFSADFSTSMAYMFTDRAGRGRVVKGHPYSADIVTETNQTLADGNVITHRNVNKVWRDGEGRTRQESYRNEKLRSVYISDPVASMSYTLLPDSKIAVQIPRIDVTRHLTAPRVRLEHGDKASRTTTTTETTTSKDGNRVIVRTVDSSGMPGVREEVRVQVVRTGDDANVVIMPKPPTPPTPPTPPSPSVAPVPPIPPIPPTPLIPGVHTLRFENTSQFGPGETKSLGSKDFEGVKADGRQTSWTIPAGKIGNRNAITVTSESWYSPDLQVTVYSRYNDPRTGESIYRLASVKRGEPSADLFKVPEGYSLKGKGAKDKEKDKH